MIDGSDVDFVKTIMIIDDDEDDRDFFCLAVRKVNRPTKIICLNSGTAALNYFSDKEAVLPDAIFLDLKMPRLSGKETLLELRKINRLTNVPIIIYSTTRTELEELEVKLLGAQDFLTKPYRFNDLVQRLQGYMSPLEAAPTRGH